MYLYGVWNLKYIQFLASSDLKAKRKLGYIYYKPVELKRGNETVKITSWP